VAPFEERSCAAEAPQAEARTESESAQAWRARKKAWEKPQVALAELEALSGAAVPLSQPPELARMAVPLLLGALTASMPQLSAGQAALRCRALRTVLSEPAQSVSWETMSQFVLPEWEGRPGPEVAGQAVAG
jgi:hypothetical protein